MQYICWRSFEFLRSWTMSWTTQRRSMCHYCGKNNGSIKTHHLARYKRPLMVVLSNRIPVVVEETLISRGSTYISSREKELKSSLIVADLATAGIRIFARTISWRLNQYGFHALKSVYLPRLNHAIVEEDYFGIKNIFVGVSNWYSPANPASLWQRILVRS